MKNFLIAVLAVAVVGLGGWVAYDTFVRSDSSENGRTESSGDSSISSVSGPKLDYSDKGLTSVGSDIYNQTSATELVLSNNSLKSLPSEMGKMTKLQILRLDNNLLEGSLIAEIRKMPLILLDASDNNLTGVPAEIGQLSELESLDLSNNGLTEFPNEIKNLSGTLKTLDVSSNPLTQETVAKLKSYLPNTAITF